MKNFGTLILSLFAACALAACASTREPRLIQSFGSVSSQPPVALAPGQIALPAETMIQVTPVQEISSIDMVEGDQHMLQVVSDVSHNGVVVIPRGAPVLGTITYRTGKGIVGKSAKFEITFNAVTVNGRNYALRGMHRQEGRGNTVAALLGSMIVSGRSAIMTSGQVVNAFTSEPIPAS